MSVNKEYARMYYRTHIKKIKARHKAWYLKNREAVIAKQIEYNKQKRIARAASRGSQKPVRVSVHSVSTADPNSPRDNAPKRRSKKSTVGKHDLPVQPLSPSDTLPSVEPLDSGYFDPATGVVFRPLSPSPDVKESIPETHDE